MARVQETTTRHVRRRHRWAALLLAVAAVATTGWTTGSTQQAVTGPPPGTAAWRAERPDHHRPPDPATAQPPEVAAFFGELANAGRDEAGHHEAGHDDRRGGAHTPGEETHRNAPTPEGTKTARPTAHTEAAGAARNTPTSPTALARRHPLVVGNLDGAPLRLRYQANHRAVQAAWRRAQERATDPARTGAARAQARTERSRYAALLARPRQLLAFDPRGRGQLVEVFGELATADRVAVLVPGSDIDLAHLDAEGANRFARPTDGARALQARMANSAPGVRTAVVSWVGYTTPQGIGPDAATARLAEAGAPRLVRFLRGLTTLGVPAPTLLCHSYGSLVCGRAARELGAERAVGAPSDLVLYGSPGVRARSVAGLHTRARVWTARSRGDWIARVPHVTVAGIGHGVDPVAPEFGARVVATGNADGHGGYLRPGTSSLRNFAAIALGRRSAVTCATQDGRCPRG